MLGFSQGSTTAARWAMTSPVATDQLILWGSPLAGDVELASLAARRAGRPVIFVGGDDDPHAPAGTLEQQAAALSGAGTPASAVRFAGGHTVDGVTLRRVGGRD